MFFWYLFDIGKAIGAILSACIFFRIIVYDMCVCVCIKEFCHFHSKACPRVYYIVYYNITYSVS